MQNTPLEDEIGDKAARELLASEKALQVKHTCCKKVGTWLTNTCGRTAKAERDGKWFCGIHDPVAIAEKDAKREVKWRAKYDADKAVLLTKYAKQAEIERRADCYTDLLEALQGLLKRDPYPKGTVGWIGQEDARKAIAKALGEQLPEEKLKNTLLEIINSKGIT